MKPRPITDADQKFFGGVKVVYRCPKEMPNCEDVEVLRKADTIKIPWKFEVDDLQHFDEVTVWLTIWGAGMPPVALEIYPTFSAPLSQPAEESDLKSD